jgi:hypothetical protein
VAMGFPPASNSELDDLLSLRTSVAVRRALSHRIDGICAHGTDKMKLTDLSL